jgi:hypothetical protein
MSGLSCEARSLSTGINTRPIRPLDNIEPIRLAANEAPVPEVWKRAWLLDRLVGVILCGEPSLPQNLKVGDMRRRVRAVSRRGCCRGTTMVNIVVGVVRGEDTKRNLKHAKETGCGAMTPPNRRLDEKPQFVVDAESGRSDGDATDLQ